MGQKGGGGSRQGVSVVESHPLPRSHSTSIFLKSCQSLLYERRPIEKESDVEDKSEVTDFFFHSYLCV